MPALSPFGTISGAYSAYWNGLSVGQVAVGGYRLRYSYDQKPITYDSVGSSPVDSLFMGLSMFLDFVCMEFKADAHTIRRMSWPFDITSPPAQGAPYRGATSAAGFSIWKAARPFTMVACNPDQVDPRSITFPKTFLAPGFEVAQDHSGTTERTIPMRLIVFPVSNNTTYGNGTAYTQIIAEGQALGNENFSNLLALNAGMLPPQGCSSNFYFAEVVNV